MTTEQGLALDLLDAFIGETGYVYDHYVELGGFTTHLHKEETSNGEVSTIVRIVAPMMKMDSLPNLRDLVYELATMLLSETTNNDACDVVVRERSAHFHTHEDLIYLNLKDDLSVVVVDAYVEDYLT